MNKTTEHQYSHSPLGGDTGELQRFKEEHLVWVRAQESDQGAVWHKVQLYENDPPQARSSEKQLLERKRVLKEIDCGFVMGGRITRINNSHLYLLLSNTVLFTCIHWDVPRAMRTDKDCRC